MLHEYKINTWRWKDNNPIEQWLEANARGRYSIRIWNWLVVRYAEVYMANDELAQHFETEFEGQFVKIPYNSNK